MSQIEENTEVVENTEAESHVVVSSDEGLFASLGLNVQLFAFQLLNFAIVAVIVWFLILKPLTKKMEERKKMIDESIDNAKSVETNLKMSEQKYQEKIDEAKVSANRVVQNAHEESLLLAEKMKQKTQEDISAMTSQAKKNIEKERERAIDEVKKEMSGLVVSAVEKILEEKMDEKSDRKIIEQAINKASNKSTK